MNCTICKQLITLAPSASERAQKFGGKPSDYTQLFTEHAECVIAKRKAEVNKLIQARTA
jgi:hypothetical protein